MAAPSKQAWVAVLCIVGVPVALLAAADPARAAKIGPGSEYRPVLQKLETRRTDLQSLEQTSEQLRDLEDAVGLAERVAKPVVPALEQIENSRMLKLMGKAPYVGTIVETAQASAAATRVGIGALAWTHDVDTQMVRPLTDAARISNTVLKQQDDRDVPGLIGAYEQALPALQRADANLTQNIRQTRNSVRLIARIRDLLQRTGRADADLMASLSQLQGTLQDLVDAQEQTQAKVRTAIAFVQDVLSAAPDRQGGPQGTPQKTTPPAGTGEKATVVPPVPGAPPVTPPAATGSPAGLPPSVPQTPGAVTTAPAQSLSAAPAHASTPPASARQPHSPFVLLGGMVVLACGLGSLAWVVAKLLATVPTRSLRR